MAPSKSCTKVANGVVRFCLLVSCVPFFFSGSVWMNPANAMETAYEASFYNNPGGKTAVDHMGPMFGLSIIGYGLLTGFASLCFGWLELALTLTSMLFSVAGMLAVRSSGGRRDNYADGMYEANQAFSACGTAFCIAMLALTVTLCRDEATPLQMLVAHLGRGKAAAQATESEDAAPRDVSKGIEI